MGSRLYGSPDRHSVRDTAQHRCPDLFGFSVLRDTWRARWRLDRKHTDRELVKVETIVRIETGVLQQFQKILAPSHCKYDIAVYIAIRHFANNQRKRLPLDICFKRHIFDA